jgi:hypothetical protein
MLVVDAANVVGSRPDGWWRDRSGAAAKLCRQLTDAIVGGTLPAPIVVVLEGAARKGVDEGDQHGLRVVHAPRGGDDTIAALVAEAVDDGQTVMVVTADRELRDRSQRAGGEVVGPRWLLDRI